MKVLAIRGRNIASLAEDFEVDLQAEPLASVNLFAIAGPTGSGKSSLLDALCLALYDQTPRLRSAPTQGSKLPDGETGELGASDSRQLLRRGASEGFAEVDFVGIDGQRWRARWSVRRARGRRDGRLQAVEMSLLQLPEQMAAPGTGKKTETLAEIERRVGLGYRQFTHAVLLAQNEFAAFLRADQDERARLLQTLTGSERFERLSVAAYERSRQEREALLRIEQELSSHRPLDEAARAKLDEAADAARRDHEAAQIRWDQDRHWLAWVQERQRRQAAVDGARARRSEAETALNQASEQRHHIARLRLLQPIRQLWLKVDDIALRLTAQRSELAASRQQLQLRQTRVAETEQRLLQAQASADQQRTRAAERQPEIENAEGLDRQIAQTEPLLVTATEARGTAKSEEAEAARALDEAQSQAERLQQAAQQSGREIETRESDAILLPHGVPWRAQIDSLQQLRPQLATHAQTLREHETQAQQLSHDLARLGADLEELDTVIEQCREGLEQRVLALRALSTTDLAARRAQLHADTEKLRARQDALRALAALRRSRRALSDALAQAEAERLAVDQALPQAGIDLSAAEAAATQAERALSAARIATAEAADGLRATLEATRPCPVCGSLEHPWDDPARLLHDLGAQAVDNRTDALRQLLATLAAQHATARQAELDQRDHLLSLRRRGEALVASIQQDHRALAELAQDIEQQRQPWQTDPQFLACERLDEAALRETLDHEQQTLAAQLASINAEEASLQAAQVAREQAQQSLDELLTQRRAKQAQYTAVQQQQHPLDLAQAAQAAQLASVNARLAQLQDQLLDWLQPLGVSEIEDLTELGRSLEQRAQAHAELIKRHQDQNARLSEISTQLPVLQERLQSRLSARHLADQRMTSLADELQQHRLRRSALLGGASVDAVRSALTQQLAQAEEALEQSRLAAAAAREAHLQALTRVEHQTEAVAVTTAEWQRASEERERRWRALSPGWAQASGLATELAEHLADDAEAAEAGALTTARQALRELLAVEPERLTALEAAQRQLDDALLRAQSEEAAQVESLQAHLDAPPAGTAPADPFEAVKQSQAQASSALLAREELQSRRLADDAARTAFAQAGEKAAAQRERSEQWDRLSQLIGSADGKKFRNLAQRRSLQLLLHHGNAQLRLLGSRYSLRAQSDELNFLLVDHELGDELRLVHSLSGGESFLVSLALALALASLSSQDLPIESLFVDEGFGSLDEDTLDVAMRALDQLQAQGRKVGVISHLRELTDRIGVKIEVIPVGNGRSRVQVSAGGYHQASSPGP